MFVKPTQNRVLRIDIEPASQRLVKIHLDGKWGALVLPNLIFWRFYRFSEQVSECHDHHSLRPAHCSNL